LRSEGENGGHSLVETVTVKKKLETSAVDSPR
jgi:hypothetical protein